jgi:hypothetical protein
MLANANGGLTPNPDATNLTRIVGPDYTGPRETYINADDPTSWPAWITAVNGAPVDTGAPGGTFQAPQTLATLEVTAKSKAWLLFLALVVLVVVVARK